MTGCRSTIRPSWRRSARRAAWSPRRCASCAATCARASAPASSTRWPRACSPIIAAGAGDVHLAPDGWTVRTNDGSSSAHAEHTIVITDGAPLVLTA
jgi:hypothetical protein